jgi:FKBP-type peptidyl-prolyl cis-trans isomerase
MIVKPCIFYFAVSFHMTHSFFLVASSTSHRQRMRLTRKDNDVPLAFSGDAMLRRRSLMSILVGAAFVLPTYPVLAKDLKDEYMQGTAALSNSESNMNNGKPVGYKKLSSGVIYADMQLGTSDETVQPGSRVNLQWVLRKSNGYFVDSSAVNDSVPFIFTVGDHTAIAGLDEGVQGMRVNGVRRLLIPPSLAYTQGVDDGNPGPLPVGYGPRQQIRRVQEIRKNVPGEYLYLEVKLSRLR